MSTEGFDDPKHGSDRKGFPEGLKDGVQEHRVLPSMDGTGKYVRDHTCHYGYGTKMNNSDKEFPNPFYCVEEGKFVTGKFVVLVECPECQEIKRVKGEKEAIEADMKRASNTKEEIEAAVASHAKWLNKHNRDFKFYVNVKDAAGRFFTVKYPSKNIWKPIQAFIEKYKNQRIPIDAIAASQGLWFRITRSGKGFKTEYAAEVVTEDLIVNGQIVDGATKVKQGPLTPDDYRKAKESCLDLRDVGIRRLSHEQVARLVASRGDPTIIQAVFAGSDPVEQAAVRDEEASPPVEPASKPAAATPRPATPSAPTPAPTPVARPITAPPTAGASASDLLAQARALMEQAHALAPAVTSGTSVPAPAAPKPAPTPLPAAPKPSTTVTPPPAPAASAEEDEFLKQFNIGG